MRSNAVSEFEGKVWSGVAQLIAILTPLLVTLDRFRRPFGDKFMFPAMGGSADLWVFYSGASAIVRHIDPYGPLPVDIRDPAGWPASYPPQTLGMFVPLVWLTKGNAEAATQVFYWVNIFAIAVLCIVVWRLLLRVAEPRNVLQSALLTVVIALVLNPLMMFALDRAQSEIISAAATWGAILLFVKRRYATAVGLVTFAAAIKGYSVPLAIGLLCAIPERKAMLRALGAALGVSVLLTLPVLPYLMHGIRAMSERLEYFFIVDWMNHSFKAIFKQFIPHGSETARRIMSGVTIVLAVGAWWRVFVSARSNDSIQLARDCVLFAGLVLALMVGIPAYSGPYNYLLPLPALLLICVCYPAFFSAVKLRREGVMVLGTLLLVTLWGALQVRWIGSRMSMAGVALIGFVVCAGTLTLLPRSLTDALDPDRNLGKS